MGHDVQSTLQPTGGVGEQIGIVSYADCCGADGSKVEAKVGAVEGDESRIYVSFKLSAGTNMPLPVALVLHHLPADLVLQLHMTGGVLVRVSAIV